MNLGGDFAKREMPYRTGESVRLRSLRYLNIRNDNYRKRTHFLTKIFGKPKPQNLVIGRVFWPQTAV